MKIVEVLQINRKKALKKWIGLGWTFVDEENGRDGHGNNTLKMKFKQNE